MAAVPLTIRWLTAPYYFIPQGDLMYENFPITKMAQGLEELGT